MDAAVEREEAARQYALPKRRPAPRLSRDPSVPRSPRVI